MFLTVDANGNDATSPDFDRDNVVQWGFHHQFNDDARADRDVLRPRHLRRRGRLGADPGEVAGLVAVVRRPDRPPAPRPNQTELDSDTLGAGNAFNTGNVAMAYTHLWYTCIVRDEEGNGREFFDLAAVPEYDGVATAKLHADTFRILDSSENPEAAFEVLTYLLDNGAPVLLDTYGGMPARDRPARSVLRRARRDVPAGRQLAGGRRRAGAPGRAQPREQHAQLRRGRGRDHEFEEPPHHRAGPRRRRGRRGAARRPRRRVRRRRCADCRHSTCGQRTRRERSPPTRRRRRPRAEGSEERRSTRWRSPTNSSTPSSSPDPTRYPSRRVGSGALDAPSASDAGGAPACCSCRRG